MWVMNNGEFYLICCCLCDLNSWRVIGRCFFGDGINKIFMEYNYVYYWYRDSVDRWKCMEINWIIEGCGLYSCIY